MKPEYDFKHFEKIGFISEPGNKDGVLFPEKINDQYVRLDRPFGNGVGSIWKKASTTDTGTSDVGADQVGDGAEDR